MSYRIIINEALFRSYVLSCWTFLSFGCEVHTTPEEFENGVSVSLRKASNVLHPKLSKENRMIIGDSVVFENSSVNLFF